jgi:hypothetical protein
MIQLTLAEALDLALDLLAAGHDVGYCLRQFPDHAHDIAPLLATSEALFIVADQAQHCWEQRTRQCAPDWETLLFSDNAEPTRVRVVNQRGMER